MGDYDEVYSIKFVYGGLWKVLEGIDPERYSLVVLKSDFTEVYMGDANAWKNYDLRFSHVPPGNIRRNVELGSDDDLMTMFSLHRGRAIVVVHCQVKEGDIVIYSRQQPSAGKKNRVKRKKKSSGTSTRSKIRSTGRQVNKGVTNDGAIEMEDSSSDDSYILESEDEDEKRTEKKLMDDWVNYYTEYGSENEDVGKDIGSDTERDFENESDNEGDYHPLRRCLNRELFQFKEGEKISLRPGMLFATKDDLKEALIDYSIQEGFQITYEKSEKKRVRVYCKNENCTWMLHSSTLADEMTFCIKTMVNEHSCRLDGRIVPPLKWIAKRIMSTVKADRKVSVKVMWSVLRKFGIQPCKGQMMRARDKALDMIDGNHGDAFKIMPQYCLEVMKSNPGSLAQIQYCTSPGEEIPWVKRFFIGFDAAKKGFLDGCRPYIGFDGCHLKGRYGGVLMSAVANDPDGGFFPLAVAYAEGESHDSWLFFFNMLKEFLGCMDENREWTFMTDRQKGLADAITEAMPSATQRKCSRHIYANFRKSWPALVMKKLFWNASMAYIKRDYDEAMGKIKELSVEAHQYLEEIDKSLWARHAFSTTLKCDNVTNNPSESFNNWLGHIRHLPVQALAEELRCKIMCRLNARFASSVGWSTTVCPRTAEVLRIVTKQGRRLQIFQSDASVFEVCEGKMRYTVRLDDKLCECGVWNHTGVPCKHVAAIVISKGYRLEDYCDPMLSTERFQKAYSHMITPVPHQSFWPPSTLSSCNPLKLKRRIGRPKTKRAKEHWEDDNLHRSSTHKCSICKEFGHNKLTCAGGLTAKQKKAKEKKAEAQKRKANTAENEVDGGNNLKQAKRKRARKTNKPNRVHEPMINGEDHQIVDNNEQEPQNHDVPITLDDILVTEQEVQPEMHLLGSGGNKGRRPKKLATKKPRTNLVYTRPLLDLTIEQNISSEPAHALLSEERKFSNNNHAARTTVEKEIQIMEENYESTLEPLSSNFATTQEDPSQPDDLPL